MGMRVSSGGATQQGGAVAWQQRQQNFQALAKALQSQDLDAAKAAYTALTKNAPAGAASNPNSALAQLGKALQSGDLAGAQQAFSAMQARHSHRQGASGSNPPPTPQPAAPTSTVGNNVNTFV